MLQGFYKSSTRGSLLQLLVSGGLVSCLLTQPAAAVSFGIYDSRGLAMGGTAVAAGTPSQAHFYNPALLSFHDADEDASLDGRISLINLVVQVSDSAKTALQAADDDLDERLSSAINNFNFTPDAASAGQVATASRDLDDLLDQLANKDLSVDAFAGFSISEPSQREGGAFFFGVRALGAGSSTVTEEDRALLNQYITAMETLAAGGSVDPALVDENGNLRDPVANLGSTGEFSALTLAEWGVALAKEFVIDGNAISFGITPKMLRVDAYRDTVDISGETTSEEDAAQSFSDSKETHLTFNADFGVAAVIEDHYRISIAVKDAFAKEFTTRQGNDPVTGEPLPDLVVELKPRTRLGAAYVTDKLTIGMDFDLRESTPMANEAPSKELSLGLEYMAFDKLALRAGYRQDQNSLREDVISGGIGYQWRRAVLEISYAASRELEAGSLQFSWAF